MPLVKLDDCLIFQSTPSVGRATLVRLTTASKSPISIHALRGEGDSSFCRPHGRRILISIHALRGEGDQQGLTCFYNP